MRNLVQKKGGLVRELTLNEFTLLVRERGIRPLKERSVLYEELQLDRVVRRTTVDPPTLLATILFIMIAIAVGVASSGSNLLGRRTVLVCRGDRHGGLLLDALRDVLLDTCDRAASPCDRSGIAERFRSR